MWGNCGGRRGGGAGRPGLHQQTMAGAQTVQKVTKTKANCGKKVQIKK